MTDVREDILKRLTVVAATCAQTKRMAVSLHASERPVIVINDGDETIELQKGGAAPLRVTMRPQMILIAIDGDNPGGAINKLRAAVIKAVLTDTGLSTIAGVHGGIRYTGCETGLARTETMEADMALSFEITYRLNPADL
jgi:hypothetical protein